MAKLSIHTENAEFQIIQALKLNRSKRKALHEIFVEGIACIKQAVKADIEITRIIMRQDVPLSDWGTSILNRFEKAAHIEMQEPLYTRLCDKTNPSELLLTAKVKTHSPQDINTENPFILAFDRPRDFGNLGAVIRSANAFGVDGLFIIGHGIDVYEPKVMRASLGSIFFTKTVYIESMNILEEYIQKNNITVIGTDSTGGVSIRDARIQPPVMLVIGNEAKGMSVKLQALCDKIVKIPISGTVNSLNAACAASILLWELCKK
jgi:TrmH family RNA methyltransferase